MAASKGWLSRHGNVYAYVPNVIGYVRIVLMLYSFFMAAVAPMHCIVPYLVSFAMDELDGRFARMFNQTSTLGQVLDMVTDRISTTGLLALLCFFVPELQLVWLALVTLDISSHWFQMYAALACGATTHKDTTSKSPMIKLYYTSRIFMGYCCVSCEVLYMCIYAATQAQLHQVAVPGTAALGQLLPASVLSVRLLAPGGSLLQLTTVLMLLAAPGVCVKQVVNVLQLLTSADKLVVLDQKRG